MSYVVRLGTYGCGFIDLLELDMKMRWKFTISQSSHRRLSRRDRAVSIFVKSCCGSMIQSSKFSSASCVVDGVGITHTSLLAFGYKGIG